MKNLKLQTKAKLLLIISILFLSFQAFSQSDIYLCPTGTNSLSFNIELGAYWESTDPSVATVDNNGLITAVSAGQTFVKYWDGGMNIYYSYSVSVLQDQLPAISGQDTVCVNSGQQLQCSPFATWSSSNNNITTVSNGYVNGISVGNVNITCTLNYSGCTASSMEDVVVIAPTLPTLTLISANSTLNQTLVPALITFDTIFYQPLDTIKFQIGGSATSAMLINIQNTMPLGVQTSFSNNIFKIFGTPKKKYPPIPTTNSTNTYRVVPVGINHLMNYCNYTYYITGSDTCFLDEAIDGMITLTPPCTYSISGNGNSTVCEFETISNTLTVLNNPPGVNVSGLPPGVNYSFNGNSISLIGNTFPGIYNYTITTNFGTCIPTQYNGIIMVDQIPLLNLTSSLGSDNQTVCQGVPVSPISYSSFGTSSNLSSSGLPSGISNNLSGDNITISGSSLQSGSHNYTVMAFSNFGVCPPQILSGIITITNPPSISPITGNNSICIGNTTQLNCSIQGGTWSSSNANIASTTNSGLVTANSTGNVTITYSLNNSGCISTSTFAITVLNQPAITSLSPNTSVISLNENIIPFEFTIVNATNITFDNPLPSGFSYTFSNNTLSVYGTGLQYGVFPFSFTASNGICSSNSGFYYIHVMQNLQISAGGSQHSCQNSNVTISGINAFGGDISWTHNGNGSIISGSNSIHPIYQPHILDAGNTIKFVITVTDSLFPSNLKVDSCFVIVDQIPNVGPINGSNMVCLGANETYSNSNNSGIWNSSTPNIFSINSNGVVTGIQSGTGLISYVVSNFACQYIQYKQIEVRNMVNPQFILPDTLCENDSYKMPTNSLNSPVISGSWSPTFSTDSLGTRIYTFTQNYNQCANSYTHEITINPLPISSFITQINGDTVLFTNTSSNASNILWYLANGTTSTESNVTVIYNTPTNGHIVLIASNDCGSDTSTFDLFAELASLKNENLIVYPNPFSNTIHYQSENNESFEIKIIDIMGKTVYNKLHVAPEKEIHVDELKNGQYFVQFSNDKNVFIKKMIKN